MSLLTQAQENLRAYGWSKGEIISLDGLCALGAMYQAGDPNLIDWWGTGNHRTLRLAEVRASTEMALLCETIEENYPDRVRRDMKTQLFQSISDFNDHPDTTLDEVIAMMEKAEAKLLEQV